MNRQRQPLPPVPPGAVAVVPLMPDDWISARLTTCGALYDMLSCHRRNPGLGCVAGRAFSAAMVWEIVSLGGRSERPEKPDDLEGWAMDWFDHPESANNAFRAAC